MKPDRIQVSLRVAGDTLRPAEITRLLRMEPSHAHAKGDPRTGKSKSGKTLHHDPWGNGIWILYSDLPEDRPLQEHVLRLVDRLEPKAAELEELRNRGCRIDLFCGCFFPDVNGGLILSPALMQRIGKLRLELGLDLYFLPGNSH